MISEKARTIFTVGHSTRTQEELVELLKQLGIRILVDVRRFPVSRKFSHFSGVAMQGYLGAAGIEYVSLGSSLGGYRTGGYEKYAQTEEFACGLEELERRAGDQATAFLCAERFPWRCHRRLIAAALQLRGWRVIHILERDRVWETRGSRNTAPRSSPLR